MSKSMTTSYNSRSHVSPTATTSYQSPTYRSPHTTITGTSRSVGGTSYRSPASVQPVAAGLNRNYAPAAARAGPPRQQRQHAAAASQQQQQKHAAPTPRDFLTNPPLNIETLPSRFNRQLKCLPPQIMSSYMPLPPCYPMPYYPFCNPYCGPQQSFCHSPHPCLPPPPCPPHYFPPPCPPCPGPCARTAGFGGSNGGGARLLCLPRGISRPPIGGLGMGHVPFPPIPFPPHAERDQPAYFNNCNFYVKDPTKEFGTTKFGLSSISSMKPCDQPSECECQCEEEKSIKNIPARDINTYRRNCLPVKCECNNNDQQVQQQISHVTRNTSNQIYDDSENTTRQPSGHMKCESDDPLSCEPKPTTNLNKPQPAGTMEEHLTHVLPNAESPTFNILSQNRIMLRQPNINIDQQVQQQISNVRGNTSEIPSMTSHQIYGSENTSRQPSVPGKCETDDPSCTAEPKPTTILYKPQRAGTMEEHLTHVLPNDRSLPTFNLLSQNRIRLRKPNINIDQQVQQQISNVRGNTSEIPSMTSNQIYGSENTSRLPSVPVKCETDDPSCTAEPKPTTILYKPQRAGTMEEHLTHVLPNDRSLPTFNLLSQNRIRLRKPNINIDQQVQQQISNVRGNTSEIPSMTSNQIYGSENTSRLPSVPVKCETDDPSCTAEPKPTTILYKPQRAGTMEEHLTHVLPNDRSLPTFNLLSQNRIRLRKPNINIDQQVQQQISSVPRNTSEVPSRPYQIYNSENTDRQPSGPEKCEIDDPLSCTAEPKQIKNPYRRRSAGTIERHPAYSLPNSVNAPQCTFNPISQSMCPQESFDNSHNNQQPKCCEPGNTSKERHHRRRGNSENTYKQGCCCLPAECELNENLSSPNEPKPTTNLYKPQPAGTIQEEHLAHELQNGRRLPTFNLLSQSSIRLRQRNIKIDQQVQQHIFSVPENASKVPSRPYQIYDSENTSGQPSDQVKCEIDDPLSCSAEPKLIKNPYRRRNAGTIERHPAYSLPNSVNAPQCTFNPISQSKHPQPSFNTNAKHEPTCHEPGNTSKECPHRRPHNSENTHKQPCGPIECESEDTCEISSCSTYSSGKQEYICIVPPPAPRPPKYGRIKRRKNRS